MRTILHATVGFGGHTLLTVNPDEPENWRTRTEGYETSTPDLLRWVEARSDEYEWGPDARIVDCTVIEDVTRWAVRSPLVDERLPAGTIQRLLAEPEPVDWESTDPYYGAGSLSTVSLDVAVAIALRNGLLVTDPHTLTSRSV